MQVKSELKLLFTGLVTQYPGVGKVFDSYWKEIVDAYSASGRHYHTLHHLKYIMDRLEECPRKAGDREALYFCLFYHDIVYEVPNVDNEGRSAAIAAQRMRGLGVKQASIDLCVKHILATKDHKPSDNDDTNLFCDADMAILGETPAVYSKYCNDVRAEFESASDADFSKGRVHELKKLLQMARLYKTPYFFEKYEAAARRNLEEEIRNLSAPG